jgi:hypothetical protein
MLPLLLLLLLLMMMMMMTSCQLCHFLADVKAPHDCC